MNSLRIAIAVFGMVLPYLVRLPRGAAWVKQYTDVGWGGFLFFAAFNAIAWGSLVGLSFLYQRPVSALIPCALGFGFLAWAHYNLDLAADAQSAIALVFIPLIALAPILVGGVVGYFVDRAIR